MAGFGIDAGNRRGPLRSRRNHQSHRDSHLPPPIVSFERSHVDLSIPLTPAITEINASGNADLVDTEYDPNDNLWLFNNIGAEISELRTPFSKRMQASVTIGFGQPGSKAAGYTSLGEGRFDVSATLYVYATNGSGNSRLFKIGFPYAKPPGTTGLNLDQADFVDSSSTCRPPRIQPTFCSDSTSERCGR